MPGMAFTAAQQVVRPRAALVGVKRDKRAQAIPALDLAAICAGEARVDLDPQDDTFDPRGLRTAVDLDADGVWRNRRERIGARPPCDRAGFGRLGVRATRRFARELEATRGCVRRLPDGDREFRQSFPRALVAFHGAARSGGPNKDERERTTEMPHPSARSPPS